MVRGNARAAGVMPELKFIVQIAAARPEPKFMVRGNARAAGVMPELKFIV
jgi:hypothetical protein